MATGMWGSGATRVLALVLLTQEFWGIVVFWVLEDAFALDEDELLSLLRRAVVPPKASPRLVICRVCFGPRNVDWLVSGIWRRRNESEGVYTVTSVSFL